MSDNAQSRNIEFPVDQKNLFREESITDLKAASIKRLVPINPDGTEDRSRASIFIGNTQLMSPEGPLPIQSRLMANNLTEAINEFPGAMKVALARIIEDIKKIQNEEETKKQDDSRIIIPGR